MAIITKLRISSAANLKNNNNKTEENSFDSVAAAHVLMSLKTPFPKSNLKMTKEEQRSLEFHKLIGKNKLFLVLDLDHTLLHTISINELSSTDKNMSFNGTLYRSDDRVTKLRPFVRNFLEEASKLFDLCVYTMGNRLYAESMVSILDPDNKYFNSRVISREDNTRKGRTCLDVVRVPKSVVVIVDDTESVWENDKTNLIVVEGYHYFSASKKRRLSAPLFSERLKDERKETDDELVLVLNILKSLHQMFFDELNMKKDIRNVLKALWKGGGGVDSMDCT